MELCRHSPVVGPSGRRRGHCVAACPQPVKAYKFIVFDRGNPLRRRDLLAASLTLPFAGRPLYDAMVTQAYAQEKGAPFEAATVRSLARELAQKAYKAPHSNLPDPLKHLTYNNYRTIPFHPDHP